jgi:hypothetical protein
VISARYLVCLSLRHFFDFVVVNFGYTTRDRRRGLLKVEIREMCIGKSAASKRTPLNKCGSRINDAAKCVFSRSRLLVLKELTRLHTRLSANCCLNAYQSYINVSIARVRKSEPARISAWPATTMAFEFWAAGDWAITQPEVWRARVLQRL